MKNILFVLCSDIQYEMIWFMNRIYSRFIYLENWFSLGGDEIIWLGSWVASFSGVGALDVK